MKVTILPHDPSWIGQFNSTKADLSSILAGIPILSIEHVGSTSIPDLLAKPVLDINIVVTPDIMDATRERLRVAGYIDMGDKGVPDRIAFREPGYRIEEVAGRGEVANERLRRNTYVSIEGGTSLKNHRDVKRMLLEDVELRREYSEVKKRLVEETEEFGDMNDYVRGKTGILTKILKRAGWSEEMLEEVRKVNK